MSPQVKASKAPQGVCTLLALLPVAVAAQPQQDTGAPRLLCYILTAARSRSASKPPRSHSQQPNFRLSICSSSQRPLCLGFAPSGTGRETNPILWIQTLVVSRTELARKPLQWGIPGATPYPDIPPLSHLTPNGQTLVGTIFTFHPDFSES